MRYASLFLCSLFFGVTACEEVVDDFIHVTAPPVLVADAWVTNQKGETYVKLTRSDAFNNMGALPPVRNARVSLTTLQGINVPLIERSPGYYIPTDTAFTGSPLETYRLRITHQGETWTAEDHMPLPPVIERSQLIERTEIPFFEDGKYLEVQLNDEPSQRDFYFWRLRSEEETIFQNQILLSNDRGLNGRPIIYEFPEPLPESIYYTLRVLSITERAHQYYRGVQQLIVNNGLSRAVPENPPSNFNGNILGFFTVAAIAEKNIEVDK